MMAPHQVRRGTALSVGAPRSGLWRLARPLIFLLVPLLPAAAPADTLDALVVTSAAADLATTEWALSKPGLHEANPLLQGPAQRALFKTAGTVAILGMSRYLERRGHRNWSRAVRIIAIVGWSGAAINNAVRASGRPR